MSDSPEDWLQAGWRRFRKSVLHRSRYLFLRPPHATRDNYRGWGEISIEDGGHVSVNGTLKVGGLDGVDPRVSCDVKGGRGWTDFGILLSGDLENERRRGWTRWVLGPEGDFGWTDLLVTWNVWRIGLE